MYIHLPWLLLLKARLAWPLHLLLWLARPFYLPRLLLARRVVIARLSRPLLYVIIIWPLVATIVARGAWPARLYIGVRPLYTTVVRCTWPCRLHIVIVWPTVFVIARAARPSRLYVWRTAVRLLGWPAIKPCRRLVSITVACVRHCWPTHIRVCIRYIAATQLLLSRLRAGSG